MIEFKKNKDLKPIKINKSHSLMEHLQNNQVPIASSCDGEGICGMCRVQIINGLEFLNEKTKAEVDFFSDQDFSKNTRLSCQCRVLNEDTSITIDTDYW